MHAIICPYCRATEATVIEDDLACCSRMHDVNVELDARRDEETDERDEAMVKFAVALGIIKPQ